MIYFWGYGKMIITGAQGFFTKCKDIFCLSFNHEDLHLKPDDLFIANYSDDGNIMKCFIVTKTDQFFAAEYEYHKDTGSLREICYSRLFIRNYA